MPTSRVQSIDAPIDGWNAYDSLDNMPPTAAVVLDNLIPRAGTVDTRLGTAANADTGTGLPVETVASLVSSSLSKLLAASDGGVWDVTDPESVVELKPASTFSNDRWQYTNFRKQDETGILILCNSEDEVQIFETPYTGLADAVFTGLTEALDYFIGVTVFKGRAYYWYDDADSFWYAQAGAYQGAMQEFPLGTFVQKGGKIVEITTWTQQDSGDGKDDFLVIIFSTGEVLLYQGDDPQSTGFFEQVGRYVTAEPLSIRGSEQYGSDTIFMTNDAYVSLSTIVQEGRTSDVPAFSRLIQSAIEDRTDLGSDFYGWDCILFANQGLFIFNVPLSETSFEQHVLNTVTQRWCRFTGINVSCFAIHDKRLFGGAQDGTVIAMMEGTSDLGEPIQFTGLPAFNYLGDTGTQKAMMAAQVITTHQNPEFIDLIGFSDFNWETPTTSVEPDALEYGTWSVNPATPPATLGSNWDEDYWAVGGDAATTKGWQNVSAYGFAVSVMVRFSKINDSVKWRSMSIRYFSGGAQ